MQEQKSEVAVLESIYLDDFSFVQAKYPYKFTVNCRPFLDTPLTDDSDLDVKIIFEMDQKYPQGELQCHIVPNSSISAQQISEIYDEIFEFQQQNKGYPIAYQLVELIREFIQKNLINNNTYLNYFGLREDSDKSQLEDDYMLQLKREKQQRLNFTPCTAENFKKWNDAFLAEMAELKSSKIKEPPRQTGRQYFESNQNMPMIDSDESGEDYDEIDQSEFFK